MACGNYLLLLAILCGFLQVRSASVSVGFDIAAEDGGTYGNYPGARREYHCIEGDEVQGMYGMYGAFWGTYYSNFTAVVSFADNDGSRGQAWLTYAEDWSWVNGTWKYDDDDTLSLWKAVNGSSDNVDETKDCLWASGSSTATGKWNQDGNTDYICIDDTTVSGSYKFPVFREYGKYEGKTFQSAAHFTGEWIATTGEYANTRGPQIIKTTGSGVGAKMIGYFCFLVEQGSPDLDYCEYYENERVESGTFTSACQRFPEPLAALPLSISLKITAEDDGVYGNYNGSDSEFHCIDEYYNIQGMYGRYGVFWGVINDNMTALVQWIDFFRGEAWLTYANDWSTVTGTYTTDGVEGQDVWDANNGVVNTAHWTSDCLYTSNVPGSLNGHWKGPATESYYCVDSTNSTLTGSYRYETEEVEEYGLYKNGTVFGSLRKNAQITWFAQSGPFEGQTGYQIIKGEFKVDPPVTYGYFCERVNDTNVWSDCFYFADPRVQSGNYITECANFPRPATSDTSSNTDTQDSGASKIIAVVCWLAALLVVVMF